jgi:hypothetical protein
MFDNPLYDGKETTRKQIPLVEILTELNDTLSKGEEQKNKHREFYNKEWDKVAAVLSKSKEPLTAKDIWALCAPIPLTLAEIRYALNNYWKDKVVKHDNGRNPFTYSLA